MKPVVAALPVILMLTACRPAPDCRVVPEQEDDRRASAGCVILHEGHLLVLDHRFGGKLGIPGGGHKAGETAQCTAHRETFEETGLDVRVGQRLGALHKGFTVYACHLDEGLNVNRALPLPVSARLEVRKAFWRQPRALDADDWRHPEQLMPLLQYLDSFTEEATGKDPET